VSTGYSPAGQEDADVLRLCCHLSLVSCQLPLEAAGGFAIWSSDHYALTAWHERHCCVLTGFEGIYIRPLPYCPGTLTIMPL
jgi:hypothetical protein